MAIKEMDGRSDIFIPTYNRSDLPLVRVAGQLARLRDGSRGLLITNSQEFYSLCGGFLNVKEFGARGNGSIDDTQSFQNAINAAIDGDTIFIPNGNYRIIGSLIIENKRGMRILGSGSSYSVGTKLIWQGNASNPLMRVLGSRDCAFDGFCISSSSAFPLHTAIQMETRLGSTITGNRLSNIQIDGTHRGGLLWGIRFIAGSGGDNNNDFHLLDRVCVANYGMSGLSIEHSQSVSHTLLHCGFSANKIGLAGIRTDRGTGAQGGSFSFINGGIGGHLVSDFAIGDPGRVIYIIGADSENSERFLITTGPSGSPNPIHIIGSRFSSNNIHVDGNMIIYRFSGQLVLESNIFGGGNNPIPKILLEGSDIIPRYSTISNNIFNSYNSSSIDPVVTSGGQGKFYVKRSNNIYLDSSGIIVHTPYDGI